MAAAVPPAVDPLADVRVVLTGPLGLTLQCANRFMNVAGIQTMDSFNMLRPADARTTIKRHNEAHTSAALRQYQLGITYEKMFQGWLYWYHDKKKRQQPIVVAQFTEAEMLRCIELERADTVARETDTKDLNPGKIETGGGWFGWSERAESAMLAIEGKSQEGPLYRVIRPVQDAGWVAPNPTMQLCYDLALTGTGYDRDNQQAWQLIQKWTIHDPIYNWLKPYELTEDGRGAWLALKAQMEGVAAINSRANAATRTLGMGQGSALWTNEYTSPFMSYATTLQQAYTSLEKCHGVDTPPATRVQRLLDGMRPSDKQVLIAIAKSHVADNLMQDWVGAVQYLQAKVDAAFPPKESHGRKRGYRQVYETGTSGRGRSGRGGRFGRGGGRGRGRGGRGGRGRGEYFNGVDISNPDRNFTDPEFRKLGREGRDLVYSRRRQNNRNNNSNPGGNGNNQHQQNDDRTIQQLNVQNGGTNNNSDAASVLTENSGAIVPYNSNAGANQEARNRGGNNGDAIGRRTGQG